MSMLPDLLLAKQREMEASLRKYREFLDHPGMKGQASEAKWAGFFSDHLPRRYAVATGKVIDFNGATSGQIDIILHDAQYSPLLFNDGGMTYVPAESVYAVFDSKQEIAPATLRATAEKVASVRGLDRTSGPVYSNKGQDVSKPPGSQPILGGILASRCGWSAGLAPHLESALGGLPEVAALDLGVAIDGGGFEVGSGSGIVTWGSETALAGFWVALLRRLQRLGTALAVDWDVWGPGLGLTR